MQFWLCVIHEENWNIIRDKEVWGVSLRNRNTINKVKPGDRMVFYVVPKKISGVFEAVSEPFESQEKIFGWGEFGRQEVFPHRVKIRNILLPREPVNIEPLIEKLEFIKDKRVWGFRFKRAMQNISRLDYELIYEACKHASSS